MTDYHQMEDGLFSPKNHYIMLGGLLLWRKHMPNLTINTSVSMEVCLMKLLEPWLTCQLPMLATKRVLKQINHGQWSMHLLKRTTQWHLHAVTPTKISRVSCPVMPTPSSMPFSLRMVPNLPRWETHGVQLNGLVTGVTAAISGMLQIKKKLAITQQEMKVPSTCHMKNTSQNSGDTHSPFTKITKDMVNLIWSWIKKRGSSQWTTHKNKKCTSKLRHTQIEISQLVATLKITLDFTQLNQMVLFGVKHTLPGQVMH